MDRCPRGLPAFGSCALWLQVRSGGRLQPILGTLSPGPLFFFSPCNVYVTCTFTEREFMH